MFHLLHLIKYSLSEDLQYRAEVFIWILTGITPIFIMFIWLNISEMGGGTIPFSRPDIIMYFVMSFSVLQLTSCWIGEYLGEDIKSGDLSIYLIKPSFFLLHYVANNLSGLMVRAIVVLPILLSTISISIYCGYSSIENAFLFSLSIFLAWLLTFLVAFTVGLMAFWIDDVLFIESSISSLRLLLGGALIPLLLLPNFLKEIIVFTPFPSMVYVPIQLFLNLPNDYSITDQLLWIAAFSMLSSILWRSGIKKYASYG